jgi:hydroxyacylglutathione hydrolase
LKNKKKIKIIKCLQDNYSYLIIDETNLNACVVDPSESKPIIDFVENNNITLKYILNTHHHFDHVGGNLELKKKYNSKVIGFIGDKNRIPEIDTLVDDQEIWREDNFEAKIYHIPGHTSGHIAFYFFKEKKIFTGDTLFSLGCGRIFEGTHEQMFHSLKKIKTLPKDIEVYCGHEYTLQNSKFCLAYDPKNLLLKNKIIKIKEKLKNGTPTVPTILDDEMQCNIFLKAKDLQTFSKLRDLKDNF